MSTALSSTWPVNLGAYRRVAAGAPLSGLAAVLLATVGTYSPLSAAAAVTAVGGDLAVLLARDGAHGVRAHAKTVVSVVSFLLATFLVALASWEGGDGSLGVGPVLLQLDANDWFVVGLLFVKTLAQAVIPNAVARFDDDALGDPSAVAGVPAPTAADLDPAAVYALPSGATGGVILGDARTHTSALPVITPTLVAAQHAAAVPVTRAGRRAARAATEAQHAPLPAPREHEPVIDSDETDDLDEPTAAVSQPAPNSTQTDPAEPSAPAAAAALTAATEQPIHYGNPLQRVIGGL